MVIFESIIAHRSFGLPGERDLLAELGRFIPFTLGLYLVVKLADLALRDQLPRLLVADYDTRMLTIEVLFGVVVPILIFSSRRLRAQTRWQFLGAALVVLGVAFNRLNVFLFAYSPLERGAIYRPSVSEIAVTLGAIALTVMIYRAIALNLPVIEQLHDDHAHHAPRAHDDVHLTVLAAVPAQTIARPITPTVPAAETPALAGVKE
jgi:Ni/Fe-hydrogenase subunit HybB-like protein